VRIPPLTPAEAGTRFSEPGGMQGWVDLWLVWAMQCWRRWRTCSISNYN